jgi:hypothetical protein
MKILKIIIPLILFLKLGEYIIIGWYFDLKIGVVFPVIFIFAAGAIIGLILGQKRRRQ